MAAQQAAALTAPAAAPPPLMGQEFASMAATVRNTNTGCEHPHWQQRKDKEEEKPAYRGPVHRDG
eukprot:gene37183-46095_t